MLTLYQIKAVYNDVVLAIEDISIQIDEGSVVVILGNNGSGKSTTLKCISGVLHIEDGEITEGTIKFEGNRIDHLTPELIASLGISHVLQGRSIFPQLNTEENLIMGAYLRRDRKSVKKDLTRIYEYFPALIPLRNTKSGFLSGGEQQMLVIGRALMSRPRILLLDEPSLGLSPGIIDNLYKIMKQINQDEKTALLIAEQNVTAALEIADYGYVLQNGKIVASGKADSLSGYTRVKQVYLGLNEDGSFISRHRSQQTGENEDTAN
jgi:branched-chain amino acid transport system ATP-binding protein